MKLSELVGSNVIDASGKGVGRVFDIVVEAPEEDPTGDSPVTVAWLVVGRRGLLERLGVPRWLSREDKEPRPTGPDRIVWDSVVEVAPGRILID
jgi:hypothetical protein